MVAGRFDPVGPSAEEARHHESGTRPGAENRDPLGPPPLPGVVASDEHRRWPEQDEAHRKGDWPAIGRP